MGSTKVNCTGVQKKETAFQLCWFGKVLELLLNMILHYGLISGKEQFKNTLCSDYDNIPSIYGRGVHITGIQ